MTNEKPGDWAVHDGWGRHIPVPGHTEKAARRLAIRTNGGVTMRLGVDGTWYPAEGKYARPDLMPEAADISVSSARQCAGCGQTIRLLNGWWVDAENGVACGDGSEDWSGLDHRPLKPAIQEDSAGPTTEPEHGQGATTTPDGGTGGNTTGETEGRHREAWDRLVRAWYAIEFHPATSVSAHTQRRSAESALEMYLILTGQSECDVRPAIEKALDDLYGADRTKSGEPPC